MKRLPHLFLLMSLSARALGQSETPDSLFYPYKNAAYLEFLGNSETLLSANYERILNGQSRGKFHYALRAGFGATRRSADSAWLASFPFEMNVFYGRHKHYVESSIGYTAVFGKPFVDSAYTPPAHYGRYDHIYVFRLGYRYMYDGILVRFTPLYLYYMDFLPNIHYRVCLSVGIAF